MDHLRLECDVIPCSLGNVEHDEVVVPLLGHFPAKDEQLVANEIASVVRAWRRILSFDFGAHPRELLKVKNPHVLMRKAP